MIHINELEKLATIAGQYEDIKNARERLVGKVGELHLVVITETGTVQVPLAGEDGKAALEAAQRFIDGKLADVKEEAREAGLHLGLEVAN